LVLNVNERIACLQQLCRSKRNFDAPPVKANIQPRVYAMIWKRTIATIVGVTAALVSVIAFTCPVGGLASGAAVLARAMMCSIGLIALWMGVRFLRFGWSGGCPESSDWMRPLVLGIGCFFPGFMFSLPITIVWADYRHGAPGNGIAISFYIGVLATIIYWIVRLKKRKVQRPS
jgi:hypothetical protein